MCIRSLLALLSLSAAAPQAPEASAPAARSASLQWVGRYDSGFDSGTEILSVQARTQRAVLACGDAGVVDVLDLSTPSRPVRLARHALDLSAGESLTSVAFHPRRDEYLAAVQAAAPWGPGRLEVRSAADGRLLGVLPTGVGPDAVAIDPTGRFAVAACEGEPFVFDAAARRFDSAPGTITVVAFAPVSALSRATTIAIPDAEGEAGLVQRADRRALEREVDWNGNGRIDARVDFDGSGTIEDVAVEVGTVAGVAVLANETEGEVFLLPLVGSAPLFLEPEVPAFAPDGERAYVTLQENNAVVVVNLADATIERVVGLGLTSHAADKDNDGLVEFTEPLLALREPDGIAVTPDGRFWVTADEGDTAPKASKTPDGFPAGGGRTVSVFDAATGALLGDTGSQLDEAAARAGLYPDDRSDNKGAEPEMVVAFAVDGRNWAAVGLERAGAIALVALSDPAQPRVVHVAAIPRRDDAADVSPAPEGLAYLRDRTTGEHFVLSADEEAGTVSVFRLRRP